MRTHTCDTKIINQSINQSIRCADDNPRVEFNEGRNGKVGLEGWC